MGTQGGQGNGPGHQAREEESCDKNNRSNEHKINQGYMLLVKQLKTTIGSSFDSKPYMVKEMMGTQIRTASRFAASIRQNTWKQNKQQIGGEVRRGRGELALHQSPENTTGLEGQ